MACILNVALILISVVFLSGCMSLFVWVSCYIFLIVKSSVRSFFDFCITLVIIDRICNFIVELLSIYREIVE